MIPSKWIVYVLRTLGHLSFEVTEIVKAREFFDCLLLDLGFKRKYTTDEAVCYSSPRINIWFAKEQTPRTIRGNPSTDVDVVAEHTAIMVPDREKVKDIERKMIAKGYAPLFPAQGAPQFTEGYFSVSFVGPDNMVFEVYTNPEELTE